VLLLENVRFLEKRPGIRKQLANADVYVNDAWDTAPMLLLRRYSLPSSFCSWVLMEKRITVPTGALKIPASLSGDCGGSKVSSKIGVIETVGQVRQTTTRRA